LEKILLVEDKVSLRRSLARILREEGFEVDESGDGGDALGRLEAGEYTLVLTDLKLPGADGRAVLRAARAKDLHCPVILMTAFGTIEAAVAAMKEGAYDFLPKPVDPEHLLLLIQRALERRHLQVENRQLRRQLAGGVPLPEIVGDSQPMRQVWGEVRRVAPTEATVLLEGESGTGKELFARSIHLLSRRKAEPFVPINCAAIPEGLLENELFGHEKGAYTGAGDGRRGKVEMAAGGTLFLDEIGDLSAPLQAKILRLLQERSFERVGGTRRVEVDLRLIAATNRILKNLVENGGFREDLFFRLNVFPIRIPPLRERPGDLPLLAGHFLRRFAGEMGRRDLTVSDTALDRLRDYHWPGNVRELENCIERAVILCDGDEIAPRHLNLPRGLAADPLALARPLVPDLDGTLADVSERSLRMAQRMKISLALQEVRGNKAAAARLLGVSYKTLLKKIRELSLEP
jgi:DNA-binding NtrC family response regulator